MRFLFDENMPKVLADVLRALGKDVTHSRDVQELGRGALDAPLIRHAADHAQFVVSRDHAMAREPWFISDVRKYGAGVFFLRAGTPGHEMKLWPLAKLVIKSWDDIEQYASRERAPFVALVKSNGRVVRHH